MNSDSRPATRTADRVAIAALVLAAAASVAGIVLPGLYRDTAESVRQAKATDLVTLVLAVPVLGLALWRARSTSSIGRPIAIGALGYLAYSYAIYAFSVVINPMTPAHIAILGLATWSLLLMALGPGGSAPDGAQTAQLPRRATGGFLVVVAAMFALLWLGQIAGAITSGVLPPAISELGLPTSPVFALDLAFAVPLMLLSGWWLIQHDHRGPMAAMAALTFIVVMGASVLAIFAVDGAAGLALEAPPVVMFGLVTGVAVVLLGMGLTGAQRVRVLRAGALGA